MSLFTDKNVQPVVLFDSFGNETSVSTLPAATDRSGTITTANTSQTLAAANPARRYLGIQNVSTGPLGVNEMGGAAVIGNAGTYTVAAGGSLSVRTNRLITIIGATAGQAFTATEY